MKNPALALAFINLPLLVCGQAVLEGQVLNAPAHAEVELTTDNNHLEWESVTLASDTLDAEGRFRLLIPGDRPRPATLRVAEEYTDVFLMPDDSLQLTADYANYDSTLRYTGRGAEANNYLADKIRWELGDEEDDNRTFDDAEAYAAHVDSLEAASNEFWSAHRPDRFPEAFREYIRPQLRYGFVGTRWMYRIGYDGEKNEFYFREVPDNYFDFLRELDLNDQAAWNDPDYTTALDHYFSEIVLRDTAGPDTSLSERVRRTMRIRAGYRARRSMLEGHVRDHQLISFLKEWLPRIPDEPELIQELHEDFRSICSVPEYRALIDDMVEQALRLTKGRPAPDFTLIDPDGHEISLAFLKGRVVFIDFWATWCAPCLVAMPRTRELQDKFADRQDVAFVYANVHDDHGRWTAYLEKNDLPGIHLFADSERSNAIFKEYNFNGIPHYTVIDRNGNILDANADNGDRTEQQIRAALGE